MRIDNLNEKKSDKELIEFLTKYAAILLALLSVVYFFVEIVII